MKAFKSLVSFSLCALLAVGAGVAQAQEARTIRLGYALNDSHPQGLGAKKFDKGEAVVQVLRVVIIIRMHGFLSPHLTADTRDRLQRSWRHKHRAASSSHRFKVRSTSFAYCSSGISGQARLEGRTMTKVG